MKNRFIFLVMLLVQHIVHAASADGKVVQKDTAFYSFDESVVNGTSGVPLGGFGCGGIKFNANNGTFSAMVRPPADAYDFAPVTGAAFSLRVIDGNTQGNSHKLKASLTNNRPNDDAVWPLHYVDFGVIDGVKVKMEGISPIDSDHNTNNMHLPYALYEISLTNTMKHEVNGALSLMWHSNGKTFQNIKHYGISNDEWSILACGMEKKMKVSSDLLSEKGDGLVTVTAKLSPGETKHVRFVVTWYNREDPELGYYMNLYDNPETIARHGLNVFDRLKDNAEKLVNGMRASNLPEWIKNQTLNALASIVINSMYKKDGRVAFAEGQWTCFGTMDQMWLARQIMYQFVPYYAWQELEYWGRTQMNNGQIHHDFNLMGAKDQRAKRSELVAWDDTEHQDYRNIQKWVDLNCGLIISVYEAYRYTGDKDRFVKLWPYVKKAGQRILDQVKLYGSKKYPYTFEGSENSYDAGGNPDPYNATLSVVVYKLMTQMAASMSDKKLQSLYQSAYEQARKGFQSRYIRDKEPFMGKHCESVSTGQWLALHLKLGEIMDAEDTDYILNKLDNFYYPYYWGLGYPQGTYDEWTPYILAHYGGLMLNTGQSDRWYVMQKDGYMRQYMNRDKVFAHPLNILPIVAEPKFVSDSYRSKMQYISIPAIWRNYYDVIGFHRDANTKELWLEPILYPAMSESLKNAYFITPQTSGTIDCEESVANGMMKRKIVMKTENPMEVSRLYLKNDFQSDIRIEVNGKPMKYIETGSGYAKKLFVNLDGKSYSKIDVKVEGVYKIPSSSTPAKPEKPLTLAYEPNKLSPFELIPAYMADKQAGIEVKQNADGEKYVTSCNNFDYMLFSNMDFGRQGATEILLEVNNSNKEAAEIEIVLDDTSGSIVGTCRIESTDSGWHMVSCPVKKIKSVHNVILRFFGPHPDNLLDLRSIHFK